MALTCELKAGLKGVRLRTMLFWWASERRASMVAMKAVPAEPPILRAGEVGEAGNVVVFASLHADIGDGVDRDEEKGQTGGLEHAHEDEFAVADVEVELRTCRRGSG